MTLTPQEQERNDFIAEIERLRMCNSRLRFERDQATDTYTRREAEFSALAKIVHENAEQMRQLGDEAKQSRAVISKMRQWILDHIELFDTEGRIAESEGRLTAKEGVVVSDAASVNSLNYFIDGVVSDLYFVVEGYLQNKEPA